VLSITFSGYRHRDKAPVSGTLTFSDSDIATLRKYDEFCERLSRAAIFVTGFPYVKTITMEKDKGITIAVSEFKESEVSEFLHLARPLFLDREPASFKTTLDVYRRAFKRTEYDSQVKYLYNLYIKGDYGSYVQFSTAGLGVFSDKMTQIWLNGGEYHQDEDKIQLVRKVESMLSEHSARGLFIAQLSGRVKAIDKLHSMVVGTLRAVDKKQVILDSPTL